MINTIADHDHNPKTTCEEENSRGELPKRQVSHSIHHTVSRVVLEVREGSIGRSCDARSNTGRTIPTAAGTNAVDVGTAVSADDP